LSRTNSGRERRETRAIENFRSRPASKKFKNRTLKTEECGTRQLGKLNHQLNGVRAAAKALGHSAQREVIKVKKRTLSAAGRAAIAKAAKRRWAKVRAQAKK
jgi:hypothetical protein